MTDLGLGELIRSEQLRVSLGLLLAVPFCPILYHLASAGDYRFDILEFFDKLGVMGEDVSLF